MLIIMARNFVFIVGCYGVDSSHCLSFSDKDFQYIAVINSVLCVWFRIDCSGMVSRTAAHPNFGRITV